MSLLERFMGRPGPDDRADDLVADPDVEQPVSFQVLFPEAIELNADALTRALRDLHPDLANARAELMALPPASGADGAAPAEAEPTVIGLAGWGLHVVKLVGFPAPIPTEVFQTCVGPAHFGPELKQDAAGHKSHVLLYYAGKATDPLEQYVALAAVASALARFDAILLLNEAAHAAFPAQALLADANGADRLAMLRSLPIPLIYGGFVKMEVAGEPGVWMRTFGNRLLRLPDLAMRTEGHHKGSETFDLFANMLAYLRESGAKFAPGHTMQVGENTYLRLRTPTPDEWFLEADGELLVAEPIRPDQINQSVPDSGPR